MITWPIFLALFLAVIAVYISIRYDDAKNNEKHQEEEKKKQMNANLEKRKKDLKTKDNNLIIS